MQNIKERLLSLTGQLAPVTTSSRREAVLRKSADDVVITYAARTPLTKARKGGLKDTPVDDLIITLLKAVRSNTTIDPALVEDICLGNVLKHDAAYNLRAAVLSAGFPVTTASSVASRWCSSGLLATQQIANQILSGGIDVGIAVGAESMSQQPDEGAPEFSRRAREGEQADKVADSAMPMGWTAENVARLFGVSRAEQDAFAAGSQQKAERAQRAGWFEDEIVPVETTVKDKETGRETAVTVTQDDGFRYGTTAEGLGKLRAAFPKWAPSTTTGGNASQITDGAAVLLLMRRSTAERLGQKILARFVQSTVIGLEPSIMGIGPTYAIPKLLGKVGLTKDDIDIFEINEAFSSMGVYCQKKLELDPAKLNPRGGAVALGHPLGCTGARQIVTAMSELKRTGTKLAVTSMCVGTGHAMAGLIVNEQL